METWSNARYIQEDGDLVFLGGVFYLVCSLGRRRSLRGFRWMSCNHCGTAGGCGPGLDEGGGGETKRQTLKRK